MSTLLPRILLSLLVAVTGLHAEEASSYCLLKNGDFELGEEGWKLGKGFVIEQGGGRSSTRALFFERTDKADKAYASQEVKLVPGRNTASVPGCAMFDLRATSQGQRWG